MIPNFKIQFNKKSSIFKEKGFLPNGASLEKKYSANLSFCLLIHIRLLAFRGLLVLASGMRPFFAEINPFSANFSSFCSRRAVLCLVQVFSNDPGGEGGKQLPKRLELVGWAGKETNGGGLRRNSKVANNRRRLFGSSAVLVGRGRGGGLLLLP